MDVDFVAPILRLDSNAWASIAEFAAPNVLLKLSLASPILFDRIKRGTRTLKLSWTSAQYIEVSRFLEIINRYPLASKIHITAEDEQKPHWTPVDWLLLPSHLTSLSITLPGLITSLLGGNLYLKAASPGLVSLQIIEKHGRPKFRSPSFFRLNCLPSSLTSLQLKSLRHLSTPYDDFAGLPADLETLVLDFGLKLSVPDAVEKVRLPTLPRSLTKLLWQQSPQPAMHWDLGALPSSLRSFTFNSGYYARIGSFESHPDESTIEGLCTHLPHLEEFIAPSLRLTIGQANDLIPSSTTRLNLRLIDASFTDLDPLKPIVAKLVEIESRDDSLAELVTIEKIAAPSLTSIALPRELSTVTDLVFPDSVTQIMANDGMSSPLPPALAVLDIIRCKPDLFPHLVQLVYPSTLTSLRLPSEFACTPTVIEALPNSLEELDAAIDDEVLSLLFDAMHQPSRLPNLRNIVTRINNSGENWMCNIPPQLERIKVYELVLPPTGLNDTLRKGLQSSSLKRLGICLKAPTDPQIPAAISILTALPLKLVSFEFSGRCQFSDEWPVILPDSLKHFSLCSNFFPGEVYQAPQGDASASKTNALDTASIFSPRLETLELSYVDCFGDSNLPEHLSSYYYQKFGGGTVLSYFDSRCHPTKANAVLSTDL